MTPSDDERDFCDALNEAGCPFVYSTTDEVQMLREFMKETFPERYVAERLYHFTKPDVVMKLLTRDSDLRCTFYDRTNDSDEWQHGVDCVSDCLRERGEDDLADKVEALPGKTGCSPWICCFSQHDDSAAMWGMYGGRKDGGYAVGFARAELEDLVDEKNKQGEDGYYLLPCLYERTDIAKVLEHILCERHCDEDVRTCREGCEDEFESRILSRIFFLTLILKDPSFAYEKEWRLVVRKCGVAYPLRNETEIQWSGSPFILSGIFRKPLREYIKRIVVSPCGDAYEKEENYNRVMSQKDRLNLNYEIERSRSSYNGK